MQLFGWQSWIKVFAVATAMLSLLSANANLLPDSIDDSPLIESEEFETPEVLDECQNIIAQERVDDATLQLDSDEEVIGALFYDVTKIIEAQTPQTQNVGKPVLRSLDELLAHQGYIENQRAREAMLLAEKQRRMSEFSPWSPSLQAAHPTPFIDLPGLTPSSFSLAHNSPLSLQPKPAWGGHYAPMPGTVQFHSVHPPSKPVVDLNLRVSQ